MGEMCSSLRFVMRCITLGAIARIFHAAIERDGLRGFERTISTRSKHSDFIGLHESDW